MYISLYITKIKMKIPLLYLVSYKQEATSYALSNKFNVIKYKSQSLLCLETFLLKHHLIKIITLVNNAFK